MQIFMNEFLPAFGRSMGQLAFWVPMLFIIIAVLKKLCK